jgi:hypothetical protein
MGKFGRELIESMEQAAAHARGHRVRRVRIAPPRHDEPEEVDAAHLSAVSEGLAQARRREFASDAEVKAAFRRFNK